MRITLTSELEGAIDDAILELMEMHISTRLPDTAKVLINAYPTHQSVLGEAIDPALPKTTEALAYYEYVHPDAPYDKQFLRNITSDIVALRFNHFFSLFEQLNARLHVQLDCQHEFMRACDPVGLSYPNGQGVCVHCGLTHRYAFLPRPGATIKMSSGPRYVQQCAWPEGTFVQGGEYHDDDGNPKSAFVEAFPNIGDYSTYLRADADTVADAEALAFQRYCRQRDCGEHTWTRMVNGTHRTDGYARCTSCGLCTTALPAETQCTVCRAPTKHNRLGEYLCLTHYKALPVEERVTRLVQQDRTRTGAFSRDTASDAQLHWYHLTNETLDDLFYTRFSEADYRQAHSLLYQVAAFAKRCLLSERYGMNGISLVHGYPHYRALLNEQLTNVDLDLLRMMTDVMVSIGKQLVNGERPTMQRAVFWDTRLAGASRATPPVNIADAL